MESVITKRETVTIDCNPKRILPDLLWVLKARSKDPNRRALHYMLKDSFGIVCTDGRRLYHFSDMERLPKLDSGVWDVQVLKDRIIFIPVEDVDFPDYRQILPNYAGKTVSVNLHDADGVKFSQTLIKIFVEFGNGVNYELLEDLTGHAWQVKSEKDKAVEFKDGSNYALIMTIRL